MNTNPETLRVDPEVENTYLQYLEAQQRSFAEQQTLGGLRSSINNLESYSPEGIPENMDAYMRDTSLTLPVLYNLKKSGVLDTIQTIGVGSKELVQTELCPITVDRYRKHHVGLIFHTGDSKFNEDNIRDARNTLKGLVTQSPIAKIIIQASQNAIINSQTKFSTETFKIADNPALSFIVLDTITQNSNTRIRHSPIDPTQDIDLVALDYLSETFIQNAIFDEQGQITQVSINIQDGVELVLLPTRGNITLESVSNTDWKISIKLDPSIYMQEIANQSEGNTCEAFYKRPTGRALIEALVSSGLYLSDSFEEFILTGESRDFNGRYGGPYTQMSRILAKIIFDGDLTRLNSIFHNVQGQKIANEQLQELTGFPSEDPGFKAFQNCLRQIFSTPFPEDTQATPLDVSMTNGSCFDVTSYYIQALKFGALRTVARGDTKFLYKTHGQQTMICTTPIVYKGITLPKGSLFMQASDGKLAFLRFTPFMFPNKDDMISAFGTEVLKAENSGDPLDIIKAMNERNTLENMLEDLLKK